MAFKMKRNHLISLIRHVGELYGEDELFLDDYIVDQVKLWSNTPDRLAQAVICFQDLKDMAGKKNEQLQRK